MAVGRGDGLAVELEGVEVRFGDRPALSGVDLRVAAGERVALIGPSGAGKSTLLALLTGGLAPTRGRVRVLGTDLAAVSPRALRRLRGEIGTVPQGLDLVGPLRVVHNVNAGRLGAWSWWRALASLVAPREVDAAAGALGRLGVADKLHERTDRLSGGEQQRVAIARVLVQRPRLILADEPVASVDPARGREVLDLLGGATAERGATLLASLHDVELALARFPRIVGLRGGRVRFDAAAEAVDAGMVAELYALEAPAGGR